MRRCPSLQPRVVERVASHRPGCLARGGLLYPLPQGRTPCPGAGSSVPRASGNLRGKQTHDSWVDKYASVSPKGRGEAGRGRQSQEDPPGQAEPTACSPCVCTWTEELCVHVFACMHDCLCRARVGRAVEPTLGFCVVLGSKPRIPHLSEGGDRPNKGRVAPVRPVGSQRDRSRAVAVSPGSSAGPHT